MAAATAVCCLWSSNAAALSLGRITVQSALGEPMRAEVEIPEINADEAASLKASVALPDAFRAAGLDYNPAMASLQVTLQRRNDGRAYIQISGDKAINDPFVDMILEARWASGRIVRDYTLLFDPPRARQAAPGVPTPAQIATQPLAQRLTAPAPATAPPLARPAPASAPTESRKASPVQADEKPGNGTRTVVVTRGETAGKIAASVKPASVSLDQMMVAMLRSNPSAFIGDNINRIKAGSVIDIPTEEQASATSAGEASRIIIAQSRDFNDFRRKLASGAPDIPVVAANRQVTGTVQAKVEEKKPVATTPDKLTLTKGAVQGKSTEELLAAERSAKEAASRAAEIARNISELGQLKTTPNAAAPMAAASQAAAAPPVPEAKAAVASEPLVPVSAPVVASAAPVPIAPKPVASAPRPASSVEPSEPSMLDGLIEDPLVPAGAIGLIALLAGLGVYRLRQRKNAAQVDSVFQESRSRPDSFFDASGGQNVNTNDNSATASSMMYSPSQLDAVDDVDPVAEADVYLAYGRDIQAEEILKDALLTNPGRLAIHHKLLEIYAKRRDTHAFESIARQAFKACNGDFPEWERICVLGLSIDPDNMLYQPGGESNDSDESRSRQSELDDAKLPLEDSAALAAVSPTDAQDGAVDLDLDLDFSIDNEPGSAINEMTPSKSMSEDVDMAPESEDLELDFETDNGKFERPDITPSEANPNPVEFMLPDLDINEPSPATEAPKQQAETSSTETSPEPMPPLELAVPDKSSSDAGMLDFDLESLSLDLGDSSDSIVQADPEIDMHENPLVTKLALAEEFRAIGDDDGARALIDEVIAEATGDMKIEAQRALSRL
jgi:pilus assembly protein FimV